MSSRKRVTAGELAINLTQHGAISVAVLGEFVQPWVVFGGFMIKISRDGEMMRNFLLNAFENLQFDIMYHFSSNNKD